MVYLLGSPHKLLTSLSLAVSRDKLVSHREGILKGYNVVPRSIQSKFVLPGYKLSLLEKFVVFGLNRMEMLSLLPRKDRFNFFRSRQAAVYSGKPVFSLRKLLFDKDTASNSAHSADEKSSIVFDCRHVHSGREETCRNFVSRPSWIYSEVLSFPRYEATVDHSKRLLCLEFLMDAVSCLVSSETVDEISMAVQIERAAYDYFGTTSQDYWSKIHDISASIAGKSRQGTIVPLLLDGTIPSPHSLLKIPRKLLAKSFYGQNIDPTSLLDYVTKKS
jgi:hypothetical protein